MSDPLTDTLLQLLRLAEVGNVELLVMLGLMEQRGAGFALTPQGATSLAHLQAGPAAARAQ